MREMMAAAAAVLPASMQVPASATTGTPLVVSVASRIELAITHARGHADAFAQVRESRARRR